MGWKDSASSNQSLQSVIRVSVDAELRMVLITSMSTALKIFAIHHHFVLLMNNSILNMDTKNFMVNAEN